MAPAKFDIKNPSKAPRTIHDANKAPVRIDPGETKLGVVLDERVAQNLQAISKAASSVDQELILTEVSRPSGPGPTDVMHQHSKEDDEEQRRYGAPADTRASARAAAGMTGAPDQPSARRR